MNFLKKNHEHLNTNKSKVSKTLKSIVVLTALILFNLSCSKDEPTQEDPGNQGTGEILETAGQITEDDFETFEGEVGIVLDARPMVRKGYKPTEVTINVDATQGNYSQTVPIDQLSFMSQLKIPLEGLSDAAKEELNSGVNVTPIYKDANGNTILEETSLLTSFQANPASRVANANGLAETPENEAISFNPNSSFYIQRMNDDGSPNNYAWRHLSGAGFANAITANFANFNGNEPEFSFSFIAIPGEPNTFAIRHTESLNYVKVDGRFISTSTFLGSHVGPFLTSNTSLSVIQGFSDFDAYKFKFEPQEDGSYIIKSVSVNLPINQISGAGLSVSPFSFNSYTGQSIQAEERTWRVVSTNIEWTVTNAGTTYLEPILPRAQTEFHFNSTLTNCGNGSLSQTVSTTKTETLTQSIGWEESLSMSTSNTVAVGMTVGMDFEVNLLGSSVSTSVDVSTDYEHTWSSTQENTNWNETVTTDTETLFAERTVTVPSGSASLVYDAFQFYDNTKVNFVQKLIVTGIDGATSLTGEEIKSQFHFNRFNGVITSVNANSIEITLKGTVTLNKLIKAESNVQDTPANCN